MSKRFYTADTHFMHENIIIYCNRPWKNVKDMNNQLIKNWNSVVGKNDDIYILGDFFMAGKQQANTISHIINRLNGNKHLLLGNHDIEDAVFWVKQGIKQVFFPYMNISEYLCVHDPVLAQSILNYTDKKFLCGHIHNSHTFYKENIYNVGVDVNNYTPISEEEINRFFVDRSTKK